MATHCELFRAPAKNHGTDGIPVASETGWEGQMITEDQSPVIEFLSSPQAHHGAAVERIETHASIVFLADDRAWKLKRAVRYDYLDFSTAARRQAMCEAELRINRRTAPALYLGVRAITREPDGSLALGGAGAPVDWVIEMARFDQEALLDRLAARNALPIDVMRPLASEIARFHAAAEPRRDRGGRSGVAWVIDGNALGFDDQGAGILDPALARQVIEVSRAELDRHGALLDMRRDAGCVRQCHGDLHLRNIVLINGRPTLFDAVEFNDDIACIDVMYDAAFLLMDLWRRSLSRHANALWNGYLTESGDLEAVTLLPLFLSCRAAVRAKTSATAAGLQSDPLRRRELEELAQQYLEMAGHMLRPPAPALVAVGGLSGSGKSTLAIALAPAIGAVPGAVVVRSDEIRKQLSGVEPLHRLGPEGYTSEMSARVYAAAGERAARVLRGGHSAIVDAVFARASDRQVIEQCAAAAGVPFVGLWLDAPNAVLVDRVTHRERDVSDADANVVREQLAQGTGPISWVRLDTSAGLEVVARRAITAIDDRVTAQGRRIVRSEVNVG
jgi:aminoglycoside phosphotransferase family enzyme/predicted kinase